MKEETLIRSSSDKVARIRLILSRIHLIAYIPILIYTITAIIYAYIKIYEYDIDYNVSFTLIIGLILGFMLASFITILSIITGVIQLWFIENWRKSLFLRIKILLTILLLIAVSVGNGIFLYTFTWSNDGTFLFRYIFPAVNVIIIGSAITLLVFGRKIRIIRKESINN